MDCGSNKSGRRRARGARYRPIVAAALVVAALAALGAVGYAGVRTLSAYTYGYGYAYQYQYEESHLIVVKHVVNDNGGGASASQFTMKINGVTATGGNEFPGSEAGTDRKVTTGSYSVAETGPSGYDASLSSGCSGTIAAGQTKTCTVTNDDKPGTLIVKKHMIDDNGGTKTAGDFTMKVTAGHPSQSSFAGSESGTTVTVDAGSYSVDEDSVSGYTKMIGAGCAGTIANGETKTCTITNDDQPGHLIVIKHVVNVNGGKAKASQFSMKINGIVVQGTNPFPGAESPGTNKTVNAGSYTVTETGPAGYILVPSADCSGTIAVGQTKTCTMLNHDIAPRLTIGYWKNHQSQTTALLPQKLGNYNVATFVQATAVFNATNCSSTKPQDAIGCLAGELLAAELNLANFASPCIQPTVNKATSFLKGGTVTVSGKTAAGVNYVGPSGTYNLNATQRTIAVALSGALDAYNNNGKTCTNP
jgi:Prealbumin-like fold domain